MVCAEQSEAEGGSGGPGGCLGACALAGALPCPRLSLLPMKPLFPPVLLSRNAVLPGADVAVAAPGAVLREVLSNALFAAVSGKLF